MVAVPQSILCSTTGSITANTHLVEYLSDERA
jgi:hypothetical protein